MNETMTFGDWLRQRRKALDLTQEDLAERTGISWETIRKFEAGRRRPSKQVAELLAEQLRISPEERELFVQLARIDVLAERLAKFTLWAKREESYGPITLTWPDTEARVNHIQKLVDDSTKRDESYRPNNSSTWVTDTPARLRSRELASVLVQWPIVDKTYPDAQLVDTVSPGAGDAAPARDASIRLPTGSTLSTLGRSEAAMEPTRELLMAGGRYSTA